MFRRIISDYEIAKQIASLINKHSQLSITHTPESILNSQGDYLIETLGSLVVGCVKIEKQSYTIAELRHLVIHPSMRGHGLARSLISNGVRESPSPIVYAMIREDNTASQKAFLACGFLNSCNYTTGSRGIFLFITTSPKWKKTIDKVVTTVHSS